MRTAFIEAGKAISKRNFFAASSKSINVLSANFGLEPPDTTAMILVLNNISQIETLPMSSTSASTYFTFFLIFLQ